MENQNEDAQSNPQPAPPPDFQTRPKTWLVESILVTLFCCLPFGIVGIVNAAGVDSKFNAGQVEEARHASEQAGKWTKIGFWVGIACVVLYILFVVVFGVGLGIMDGAYEGY